uniref:Uncharacterized protein n=1 Tax=Thermogemmatispora argillosa TaxID=2045280 RepID=A0A455T740_9CHLR|nr:hypothetical protein KTA_23130 [Thermogemmatispora argillosa]
MKSKLIIKTTQPARPLPHLRRSLQTVLISLTLLLVGAVVLTWQLASGGSGSQASGASVLGPPTLPAATVNRILASTPMAGTGEVVEQAARQTNIDDAFALAVWYVETNQGAAGVGLGDRNPGGVRASPSYPSDAGGYTIYPSYAAAIQDWFSIVQQRYIARGLTTVYLIAGPYVGTSSSGSWAAKVMNLMTLYRSEAPPPTPTPTPTPATLKYKIATALQKKAAQQTHTEREDSPPVGASGGASPGVTAAAFTDGSNKSVEQSSVMPVVLGLGCALALALGAIWLRRRQRLLLLDASSASALPASEPVTDTLVLGSVPATTTSAISFSPGLTLSCSERDTDALPHWGVSGEQDIQESVLSAWSEAVPWSGSLPRRPKLQPLATTAAVPLLAGRGAGPGSGLLSRYGTGAGHAATSTSALPAQD